METYVATAPSLSKINQTFAYSNIYMALVAIPSSKTYKNG